MRICHPVIAILLCSSAAARAQEVQPLIARPLTLPSGSVDLTLHGTYTNWDTGGGTLDGETLAAGVDFGATDQVELGLALALPINPGAGFGSVLGTVSLAASKNTAVRLDAGYESIGVSGGAFTPSRTSRYFAGIGAPMKIPISPALAFVTGRTGAVQFGHFNNIGSNGTGLYLGASGFSEAASDFLVISGGSNNSSTNIGINLPLGLLLQAAPQFAVTLQAGYSTVIETAAGSTVALHYIPLALEAVLSPAPVVDIGLRFFVDGYVGASGSTGAGPGYFDTRAFMFWLRLHV